MLYMDLMVHYSVDQSPQPVDSLRLHAMTRRPQSMAQNLDSSGREKEIAMDKRPHSLGSVWVQTGDQSQQSADQTIGQRQSADQAVDQRQSADQAVDQRRQSADQAVDQRRQSADQAVDQRRKSVDSAKVAITDKRRQSVENAKDQILEQRGHCVGNARISTVNSLKVKTLDQKQDFIENTASAVHRIPECFNEDKVTSPKLSVKKQEEVTPPKLLVKKQEEIAPPKLPMKTKKKEDGLYSNLQELHKGESPPAAPDLAPADAPGNYVKTLLDVWDVYIDPSSNRIYYINKETNERTFKPPRHPNKEQHKTSGQKPIDRKKSAPELKISRDLGTIPDGWRIEERDGEKLYVNSATNETWGSNLNVDGERYYYKHGSNETAWELPKILTTPDSPSAPQTVQRERSPNQSPKMGRSVKARSMFIGSKIRLDVPANTPSSTALPKSSTLPLLSSPALMEETDLEKKSLTPAPHLKDALDGYLNKAKIVEAGKSKSKKWSQSYVKLSGSNLVFYKNEAAAKSQPGSPHGRPEFIVPLLAAQVDKDKDKSSKKNVISLRTSQGDQYLLQHDDQATILKWLTHLSVAISGLGGNKVGGLDLPVFAEDSSSKEKRKGSFKIFHGRNNSASEGEGTSLERRKRLMIKDKLINFVSRRPSKESLEQKGIIKDAVFGAHLKVICDKEKGKIPKFVQKCVNAIEKRGLDHDGLYRISGNLAQIQKLRCQVDQDSYNLDEDRWDVHVLTGSLKLFFRELKEPLYTYQMFDKFIPILAKEKNSDRQKAVKELISTLPKCNYETMKFLFNHLTRVIEMSKENRMQVHNVAIVFGPTLIWPEKESPNMAANMVYQSRIVEYCLLEYKYIFR